MVVAVAKAVEAGARAIVCASTGNTSASAAAYGAAAGLEVIVVLPKGQIAVGKLLQALDRRGAGRGHRRQLRRRRSAIVRALAEQDDHPVTLVNSVNPFRLEGQKTAAFEVCDDLGRAPDVLAIPVGNAGNISAYWAGLPRRTPTAGLHRRHAADVGLPGGRRRAARRRPPRSSSPETIATAIRIGDPASWTKAIAARDALGRPDRGRDRRRDPGRLPRRWPGSRASSASRRRRPAWPACASAAAAGELDPDAPGRLRADRARPQGPDDRRAPGRRRSRGRRRRVGAVAVALGW